MKVPKSFSIDSEFLADIMLQLGTEAKAKDLGKPQTLSDVINELLKSRFSKSKETRRNAAAKRLAQIVKTSTDLKTEEQEILRYLDSTGKD